MLYGVKEIVEYGHMFGTWGLQKTLTLRFDKTPRTASRSGAARGERRGLSALRGGDRTHVKRSEGIEGHQSC
jgi:hypothetical protein